MFESAQTRVLRGTRLRAILDAREALRTHGIERCQMCRLRWSGSVRERGVAGCVPGM